MSRPVISLYNKHFSSSVGKRRWHAAVTAEGCYGGGGSALEEPKQFRGRANGALNGLYYIKSCVKNNAAVSYAHVMHISRGDPPLYAAPATRRVAGICFF